jgi:hypothetical protein
VKQPQKTKYYFSHMVISLPYIVIFKFKASKFKASKFKASKFKASKFKASKFKASKFKASIKFA